MSSNARAAAAPHSVEVAASLPTSLREGVPGESFLDLSQLPVPCSASVCYLPVAVVLHLFSLFPVSGSTLVFPPTSRDFHF